MGSRIRVYTELLDFSSCLAVIRSVGRIGEKKLRFALGRVFFNRDHNSRANQHAVFSFLRGDDSTLFDAETPSQFGRDHDYSSVPYFRRFHALLPIPIVPECQYVR
jgi:hypothetical protein